MKKNSLFKIILLGTIVTIFYSQCKTALMPSDDYFLIIHQDEIMRYYGTRYVVGNGWIRVEEYDGCCSHADTTVVYESRISRQMSIAIADIIKNDSFYQLDDSYRASLIDGFYRHTIEVYSTGQYKKIVLSDFCPEKISRLFIIINSEIKPKKWQIKNINVREQPTD